MRRLYLGQSDLMNNLQSVIASEMLGDRHQSHNRLSVYARKMEDEEIGGQ